MGYKAGQGLIACVDEESNKLAKKLTAQIMVAEFSFRAWSKGEEGSHTPCSIQIPPELKAVPTGKILTLLDKANGWDEDTFKFRSVRETDGRRQLVGVIRKELRSELAGQQNEVSLQVCRTKILFTRNG